MTPTKVKGYRRLTNPAIKLIVSDIYFRQGDPEGNQMHPYYAVKHKWTLGMALASDYEGCVFFRKLKAKREKK